MEITSLTNAKVKQWAKYKEKKYRDKEQRFLIEGEHLIEEAAKAELIECILIEQGKVTGHSKYPIYEVTKEILKKLSDSVSSTSIMAVCHIPEQCDEELSDKILILDGVQDPGNVGTMLRTALSFSYHTVFLSQDCADVYNEKVIRSTQGAMFHMTIRRGDIVEMIRKLQEEEYTIYGTSLHEAAPLSLITPTQKHALIMGNEGKGVRQEVLTLCDQKVYIEMDTFESLNVAVAAAICMYEFKK